MSTTVQPAWWEIIRDIEGGVCTSKDRNVNKVPNSTYEQLKKGQHPGC